MAPPNKAKLHNKTGRIKNINKTYVNSSTNGSSAGVTNQQNATQSIRSNQTTAIQQPSDRNSSNSPLASSSNGDSNVFEQFELELCWCIQTLEKSLESGKLSAKQAQDTDKTLRSLKSNNQPMIKKRQLMQSALGDYRKKMSDEEKKLRIGNSSIQFIDNSADKTKGSTAKATNTATGQGHFVKKSFTASLGDPNFKFNFAVNEIGKMSLGEQSKNPNENSTEQCNLNAPSTSTSTSDANLQVNAKPFIRSKLGTSDNSFKFNFTVEHD